MSLSVRSGSLVFLAVLKAVLWPLTLKADSGTPFAREGAYETLYREAERLGYSDLAEGTLVLLDYRRGLEGCLKEKESRSTKAFALFLDSIIASIHGHLHHPGLRRKAYRNQVADYVTQCAALIERYVREKAARFNGGEGRPDAEDERLVATVRRLQGRTARLLQVGTPSLDAALRNWQRADLGSYANDARYGWAVKALQALPAPEEAYCRAQGR